jgi:hypothetical protein
MISNNFPVWIGAAKRAGPTGNPRGFGNDTNQDMVRDVPSNKPAAKCQLERNQMIAYERVGNRVVNISKL